MSKKRGKRSASNETPAARGKRAAGKASTPVAAPIETSIEAPIEALSEVAVEPVVEASSAEALAEADALSGWSADTPFDAPAEDAHAAAVETASGSHADAAPVEASVAPLDDAEPAAEPAPVAEVLAAPVAAEPAVRREIKRVLRESDPAGAYPLLADFDRRSLAHDPGVPEQIEAPGLWRAIGFRVGDHRFVSGIDEISEILLSPPPVTSIPSTRPWLLGVSNVRGNLIALVDLKQFLFEKRTHVTPRARVLVVRQNGGNVGLLVDELLGQRNLTDADRAGSEGEADPSLARFVTENVTLGATRLGRFSMVDLAHAPEFAHAAT